MTETGDGALYEALYVTPVDSLAVARLRTTWMLAREVNRWSAGDHGEQEAEAEAWDALVEYVEVHGLNYGPLDPRNRQ